MTLNGVLSFSDLLPNDTIDLFCRRLANRSGILIGDQYAPVDPPVFAFVAASAIVGYRKMSGRWMATCECGGCEVVDQKTPIFMCCSCFNEADGRQYRRVLFPVEMEEIEAILSERPGDKRFWRPGETLDQLRAENESLGVAGGA